MITKTNPISHFIICEISNAFAIQNTKNERTNVWKAKRRKMAKNGVGPFTLTLPSLVKREKKEKQDKNHTIVAYGIVCEERFFIDYCNLYFATINSKRDAWSQLR